MIPSLNPRKLAHIGHARGWAAVAFEGSGLKLTTARAEGAELAVVQEATASAVPPDAAADAPLQWQYAAQSLRQQFDPSEHRLVTSVDGGDVFCQILRLPATDPAELKQMLDLQIDNITPLPLEEVVYSFEPLDIVDGQTRVLVAIARKATVNQRVEALDTRPLNVEHHRAVQLVKGSSGRFQFRPLNLHLDPAHAQVFAQGKHLVPLIIGQVAVNLDAHQR